MPRGNRVKFLLLWFLLNASVTISGSNATEIPADDTHGALIGTPFTGNVQTTLKEDQIPRWVKVRVTFYGTHRLQPGGSINVSVKRRRYQI